jgi:hypothetical protein
MSRTIEAIIRHMAPPPSRVTDQSNRVQKLEKEITLRKRVIPEIRANDAPFRCHVGVAYNGKEVDGKSVLKLMTLAPRKGSRHGCNSETRSYWAAVVFTCIDDIILAITSFSASSLLIQRNTATMSLSQSM